MLQVQQYYTILCLAAQLDFRAGCQNRILVLKSEACQRRGRNKDVKSCREIFELSISKQLCQW